MHTLELEIRQQISAEEQDVCRYPISIRTFEEENQIGSCEDELNVKVRTIRLLEALLTCFDRTLRSEQYEPTVETIQDVEAILLSVGLTKDAVSHSPEALAVVIGHLLLTDILFTSRRFQARYRRACEQPDGFRLRLIVEPQSLRRWTWEFLWDKSLLVDDKRCYEGFLGISRNKTISHSLGNVEEPPHSQELTHPLRMLLAMARPQYRYETTPTKLDAIPETEWLTQVQAALRGWCKVINLDARHEDIAGEAEIELYVADHVSWSRLQDILVEHSERPFDVFQYVGHAWFSNDESKGYCLALESEENAQVAREVMAAEIGEALAEHGTSLVLLNGCETSRERETAEGIVQTVASFGIPAVIGMRYKIRPIDGINFAENFFAGLLDGKPIDFLVNDTRNVLGRRSIFDSIFDDLDHYEHRVFKRGVQYLYPTVYLHPLDGCIFRADGSQHTDRLRGLEKFIRRLAHSNKDLRELAEWVLLKYRREALGLLWIALLSDIAPEIQCEVANVLKRTRDELAVYPLAEALVNNPDTEVRRACEEALSELGQNPAALGALVDQYVNRDAAPGILEVIKAIDSAVADSAVWLQLSTELYQAVQDFYVPVSFLVERTYFGKAGVIDLINEVKSVYKRYHTLRQEEMQIYSQIKSMDESIDRSVRGISDQTVQAIIEREGKRETKDRIDNEINALLDSFLDLTYQTLTEVLDYLALYEAGLRTQEQVLDGILQKRLALPQHVPAVIREKVQDQAKRLDTLREELQALLGEENALRQVVQTVQDFREGFSPISR